MLMWSPEGIEYQAATRMNARFLFDDFETYRHKYRQKEKCLLFGTGWQARRLVMARQNDQQQGKVLEPLQAGGLVGPRLFCTASAFALAAP